MSWALLITLLELVGILSAAHAIMSVRTPQGTIAWAVSLVAAPFLSVPAYWVFGRNKFKGYVRSRRPSALNRFAHSDIQCVGQPRMYECMNLAPFRPCESRQS